jgi:D-sedoheptulose 7-phosphate isomerase
VDFEDRFRAIVEENVRTVSALQTQSGSDLVRIADALSHALLSGHKVLLCGSGGSAADAQHVAAELVGRFAQERQALPAIALTTDTSILTALSNDYAFDRVFSRQVEALAQPGDVVVGISTSGNSEAVIGAMQMARTKGALTIGFTGQTGGRLKDGVDLVFQAPSDNTARIQEAHILVWHALCEYVEAKLVEAPSP